MTGSDLSSVAYKSPPITEAVIGINFSSPISPSDIEAVVKKFSSSYPDYQTVSTYDVSVELVNDQTSKPTADFNQLIGHRLSTADMTQILLLWPSSITISQLSPYQGWDDLFKRFVRDWSVLKRIIGFQTISRVGVRYINRVDIPVTESILEYEKYLNIYPKMPELLNHLEAYAMQSAAHLKDIDCQLKLNTASVPSPLLDHGSFVIDQDISKAINPPQSDKDIYDLLNKIRVQKNLIFEACINVHARKLFNE